MASTAEAKYSLAQKQAVTFSESDSEGSMVVASLGVADQAADHSVGVTCASEGDSEGSMAVALSGAAYSPDSLPELGLQDDGSTEGDIMIDIGGAEGQATTVLNDNDSDEGNGQAPSAKEAHSVAPCQAQEHRAGSDDHPG